MIITMYLNHRLTQTNHNSECQTQTSYRLNLKLIIIIILLATSGQCIWYIVDCQPFCVRFTIYTTWWSLFFIPFYNDFFFPAMVGLKWQSIRDSDINMNIIIPIMGKGVRKQGTRIVLLVRYSRWSPLLLLLFLLE